MRLRLFTVDASGADVLGDEPISLEGEVCGWVTSGGYAHASGVSVAVGCGPEEIAEVENGWEIEVLGERRAAKLLPAPLFDPDGRAGRG